MIMKHLNTILENLKAFFHWWTSELTACVPEKVREFFKADYAENQIIILSDKTEVISNDDGEECHKSFSGPIEKLFEDENFNRYLRDNTSGLCSVLLDPSLTLNRTIELPKAVRADFKNAVKFQLASLLPLPEHLICYDCVLSTQKKHPDYVDVHISMIKKSFAHQIVSVLEDTGLGVKDIKSVMDKNYTSSFEYLNLEQKYKHKNRNLVLGLVTSSVVLASVFGILLVHSFDQRETFLNEHLKTLAQRSKEVLEVKGEIDTHLQKVALYNRYLSNVGFDQILEQLTAATPDDSWVHSYRQSGRKITLSGISPNSGVMVESLSQNPLFGELSNASSTLANEENKTVERFTLKMRLKQGEGDE